MNTLLKLKGFTPFLIVLIFNAMIDIAHKITIQNVLIKSFSGDTLLTLSALVNALILLPFIILFSPSGWISDRFDKSKIVQISAFVGLILSIAITICYYNGLFITAFIMTLLLAIQSAIYSPAKYALIRYIVGSQRLASANALVQASTITAILFSGLLFSYFFESLYDGSKTPSTVLQSIAPLGWGLIIMALFEYLFSLKIPKTPQETQEEFKLDKYLKLKYLRQNISILKSDKSIWLSSIGLAIFWGLSQLIIALFPTHYKLLTGDDNSVIIQGILALSAVGIVIGSLVAGKFSRLHIELGFVSIGAFGLFIAINILAYSSSAYMFALASLIFGFFGGLAIVPLNATIQFLSPKDRLGVILAGNNFIQNIVMLISLIGTIFMVSIGLSTYGILFVASIITILSAIYALSQLPQLSIRLLLIPILSTRYRLRVKGLENLPPKGGVLLLGNHISWIDWLILQIASPRRVTFVMEKRIYEQWYLKWFLKYFGMIPISSSASKGAIEAVRERLNRGEVVALFPEGRISYNGQLGEFKRGFEKIMEECKDVPIVPFYLYGLWGSTFSRANSKYRLISKYGSRRDIGVYFAPPMAPDSTAIEVKQNIRVLSLKAWSEIIETQEPWHIQFLYRSKEHLFHRSIADSTGADLNRLKVLTATLLFIKSLKHKLVSKHIGIILPSSSIGAIINIAITALGKVPINLNYTLSPEAMISAINKADIEVVISSKQFLKRLSAKGFDPASLLGDRIIFVEDIAKEFDKKSKIISTIQTILLPAWFIRNVWFKPLKLTDTATILFSSGSEGTPKGIELTHKNILGNIKQVSAMLNFSDNDAILGSLPIFHSFGLTVTTLLPLCEGVPVAFVPDPTDAFSVGKTAFKHKATIIFGTSTFFRLYTKSRKLHPLMFESIRMGVAGAEKLKPEIKEAFKAKFGINLYEGYGATETSPVISVNMPDSLDPDSFKVIVGNRVGTVGQPLPGTIIRICDPETMQELKVGEDGLITIAGVQVMKGYLNEPKKTDEVIVEIDGIRYYKTGDKGHIDSDGFITIIDRYSRFAKIGGEMISLTAVEDSISKILDRDIEIVAVNVPDEKKGEKIVLLFSGDIDSDELSKLIKSSNIAPLMQPSSIKKVESLPKLASGKRDFKKAKEIVNL